MPQDDKKVDLGKAENYPIVRFARENMQAERQANKNIDKDPVGPIKARANTRARLQATMAGPDLYSDWPKDRATSNIRTPDKSPVGPSIHDKTE